VTQSRANDVVLNIDKLSIGFPRAEQPGAVVRDASLQIAKGEFHGLVGESGCGKTMLARATLGLLPAGGKVLSGSITLDGEDLLNAPAERLRQLRGPRIGMVFQEPMMSLNPALKIGRQMAEAMEVHTDLGAAKIRKRSLEMLERVRMPNPERCLSAYPHEFSGGMRQRIMLASVLMMRPALLLADEPTTALDVLIQQEILEIMVEIVRDLGTAVLLITHDLGVIAKYADRVTIMQHGDIVEQGDLDKTLMQPRHDYTRQLLAALPCRADERVVEASASTTPLVIVRDLDVTFRKNRFLPWQPAREVRAVNSVSFDINENETLAVVGESGSGKTTLGRAILKLVQKSAGRIEFAGQDLDSLDRQAERLLRRRMQIVFQDPYSSLDPRKRISSIVGEGLRLIPGLSKTQRAERVRETLRNVGLDPDWGTRYPHELSGGQRQRIGIARAIITEPQLIVADEAVSALDLTVQAQVLDLLKELQQRMAFSYLFISHDLGVVNQVADRIIVMYRGAIVEIGSTADIFEAPAHPYTCALLNAVPQLEPDSVRGYSLADRSVTPPPPPSGLHADTRFSGDAVAEWQPTLVEVSDDHFVAYNRATAAGQL
jgi:peptide/nickel transport system ATP-binding protein